MSKGPEGMQKPTADWCCFLLGRQHISVGHCGAPRCKDSGRFRLIFKGKKKSLSEKWRRDNNTCGCTSEDNGKNNQISCSWEETNCTQGSGRHFHPLLSFAQLAAALLLWKREVEGGKGSLFVLFSAFFFCWRDGGKGKGGSCLPLCIRSWLVSEAQYRAGWIQYGNTDVSDGLGKGDASLHAHTSAIPHLWMLLQMVIKKVVL